MVAFVCVWGVLVVSLLFDGRFVAGKGVEAVEAKKGLAFGAVEAFSQCAVVGNAFSGFAADPSWGVNWSAAPASLEFLTLPLSNVVVGPSLYNWSVVDTGLQAAAERAHHLILRFWVVFPSLPTGVPLYLRHGLKFHSFPGGECPDFSNQTLIHAMLQFVQAFGARYGGEVGGRRGAGVEVGARMGATWNSNEEERMGERSKEEARRGVRLKEGARMGAKSNPKEYASSVGASDRTKEANMGARSSSTNAGRSVGILTREGDARHFRHPRLLPLVFQAGLLGFWGEWNTYPYPWMPGASVKDALITALNASFPALPWELRLPSLSYPSPLPLVGLHDDSFTYSTLSNTTDWFFWNIVKAQNASLLWHTGPQGGEVYPPSQPKVFSQGYGNGSDEFAQNFSTCVATTHATWMLNQHAFTGQGYVGEDRDRMLSAVAKMGFQLHLPNVSISIPTKINPFSKLSKNPSLSKPSQNPYLSIPSKNPSLSKPSQNPYLSKPQTNIPFSEPFKSPSLSNPSPSPSTFTLNATLCNVGVAPLYWPLFVEWAPGRGVQVAQGARIPIHSLLPSQCSLFHATLSTAASSPPTFLAPSLPPLPPNTLQLALRISSPRLLPSQQFTLSTAPSNTLLLAKNITYTAPFEDTPSATAHVLRIATQ